MAGRGHQVGRTWFRVTAKTAQGPDEAALEASMAVEAPELGAVPRNPPGGPLPHSAGALQVGWPQTPVPGVRGPQTLWRPPPQAG